MEAVLPAEVTENGARLVELVAVLCPDWKLTGREFAGLFDLSPLLKAQPLVYVLDLLVSKENAQGFASGPDPEIGKCASDIA